MCGYQNPTRKQWNGTLCYFLGFYVKRKFDFRVNDMQIKVYGVYGGILYEFKEKIWKEMKRKIPFHSRF